ncbi:VOC family protein [Chitinimonas lacunae]|uniref:VOC family protein n=1 Tax=Chitinimonas lacunae TaxID=1963018 RepID=A0ABV8MW09_9NEIS
MSYLPGKFVWFDHIGPAPETSERFYEALFGWRTEVLAEGYRMILNGQDAIGALRSASAGHPAYWLGYLAVDDVDDCCAAVNSAGGTVSMPPTDFPPLGRAALVADPQGLTLSLWCSCQGDRPDAANVSCGDWYWNELLLPDPDRALAFYRQAFGYDHDSMATDNGRYYVLKRGGQGRVGLTRLNPGQAQPHCLPYVRVADCHASTTLASRLDARVDVPPTDVPGVGRFAVLTDPEGAPLGLLQGNH